LAHLDFVPISSTAVSTRSAATLIEPFGKKRWSTHQIRLYLTTSPCLNHTKFASAFESSIDVSLAYSSGAIAAQRPRFVSGRNLGHLGVACSIASEMIPTILP
jgi:hypothetical protein